MPRAALALSALPLSPRPNGSCRSPAPFQPRAPTPGQILTLQQAADFALSTGGWARKNAPLVALVPLQRVNGR